MAIASADALVPLQALLRQLRDMKGVQQKQTGMFALRGTAFANFHDEQGVLHAELKKSGGSGFDRYPLATPAEQRKFIDDAKRRASVGDDE